MKQTFNKFLLLLILPMCAVAETSTLELSSTGSVKMPPNFATINLSVETLAKTAHDAAEDNAKKTTAVITTLKKQLTEPQAITTQGYQLSPVYDYNKDTQSSELTGYKVENKIIINTKKLSDIGSIVDKAVTLGVNHIDQIQFDNDERHVYEDKALTAAIQHGIAEAKLMAEAAGVHLGHLITLTPNISAPTPHYTMLKTFAMNAAPSTPLEAGDAQVNATVFMKFTMSNSH